MLRFGPDHAPVAILALPLFEEANRTRAFAVAILRLLAARGVAGVLPDLPGQGESTVALGTVTLTAMRNAYRSLTERFPGAHAIGIRSGALLDRDGMVRSRWWLSPQDGATLVRDLMRVRQAERIEGAVADDPASADSGPVLIAGNAIAPTLLADLQRPEPGAALDRPTRTIRLIGDPSSADGRLSGSPLWRRSEPGNDPALALAIANDIHDWIATCDD